MPPGEVRYRPEALADLAEIFRGMRRASGSVVTARRYVERIRARCHRIARLPLGGLPRDDLAPGLRTVPFERRAVIAYRVVKDTVEITNIFHGRRDYAALHRRGSADDDA